MKRRAYALARVSRYVDLFDSEALVRYLNASALSPGTKNKVLMAYKDFLHMYGLPIPKLCYYREVQRLPFIPSERELDDLISGVRLKRSCFLRLLKDTGLRPIEAWRLKWTHVDILQKTVDIASTKRGYPRRLRVSDQWLNMAFALPRTHEYVFSASGNPEVFTRELESCARNFTKARKRLSLKLQNPRLCQISLYTFRHWKATTEYLRTRDIFHVKELLGHKQINTTLKYIHTANAISPDDQKYTCKAAKTETEAKQLIEEGFQYVCEVDAAKLFRKPK